ncbi:MAG: TIGR04283 family arsenosugar biosynthesis glycosyltransferase [Desulfobacter sp.]|nr:TIGR04283 family arsenosugar biosynthesis glycosyltransferase [Desulfobacter sp.]WDP84875.1 MAG: TIGR04283 family arsenosugar biosynthesis glycosyltransferase [Desulfobacter sp.]
MKISIIIPVYKETISLVQTLKALADIRLLVPFEILVVDGEKKASTLSFLRTAPEAHHWMPDPGIRMIASARGRGIQMNAGARAATGDLFLFLHADTRPSQAGMDQMIFGRQTSGPLFCGAFDLAIDSPKPVFRIIERTASLRSRLTRIPYGDQGIFISKDLFNRVGGFPDLPLMEDVGLMAAVKKKRIPPFFPGQTILTSARRWETRGIISTTLKNWGFIFLYAMGVSPWKLEKWYYS